MDNELKQKLLKCQVNLNFKIMELTEQELVELIKEEQQGKRRAQYVMRCYRRFSILRKKRERGMLLAGAMTHKNTIFDTSTDEVKSFDALIYEQNSKKRAGVMNGLYMDFYNARRKREEVHISEFRF